MLPFIMCPRSSEAGHSMSPKYCYYLLFLVFVCMLYICMGTYVWNPGKFFSSNLPYAFSILVWGQCLSLKLEPDKNGRAASPRNVLISVSSELKYQHTSLNPIFQKATACMHMFVYMHVCI